MQENSMENPKVWYVGGSSYPSTEAKESNDITNMIDGFLVCVEIKGKVYSIPNKELEQYYLYDRK